MMDLVRAKRLMLAGTSDLAPAERKAIAGRRWVEAPGGWRCEAPDGAVLIQNDGRGLFLQVLNPAGRSERDLTVAP